MSHVISTQINDELYCVLEKVAKTRESNLSEIILEALNYYCADYKEALERLNTMDGLVASAEVISRSDWDD